MKKIEILARVSDENGNIVENFLMSWADNSDYFSTGSTLYYPGLEIRLEQHKVLRDNCDVYLTRYEYGILSYMAQHPGTLFSKEQLFEVVWGEDSESCLKSVSNTIARIRKKIELEPRNPLYIQTISNLGYIFAAKKSRSQLP